MCLHEGIFCLSIYQRIWLDRQMDDRMETIFVSQSLRRKKLRKGFSANKQMI